MPIAIRVVTDEQYATWLAGRRASDLLRRQSATLMAAVDGRSTPACQTAENITN